MPSPTNDVSQHALAAEVSAYLTGPPVRYTATEIAKLIARFKTNVQDRVR
jgi:hypothetical protein